MFAVEPIEGRAGGSTTALARRWRRREDRHQSGREHVLGAVGIRNDRIATLEVLNQAWRALFPDGEPHDRNAAIDGLLHKCAGTAGLRSLAVPHRDEHIDIPQQISAGVDVSLVSLPGLRKRQFGDDRRLCKARLEFAADVAAVTRRCLKVLEIFVFRERQYRLDPPPAGAGRDRHLVGALGETADQANDRRVLGIDRRIVAKDVGRSLVDRGEYLSELRPDALDRPTIELVRPMSGDADAQRQTRLRGMRVH
jgi:hypothetical protein